MSDNTWRTIPAVARPGHQVGDEVGRAPRPHPNPAATSHQLDVDRVLAEMGRVSASLSTRKRTLRRAHAGTYRDQIATACNHALTHGDFSLVLYDVTTLYFEAEKEDEGAAGLRKVGYSKERGVDPQIVVGLLVDRRGFPPRDRLLPGQQGRDPDHRPDHQAVPRTPRPGRDGRRGRRRDAVRGQPARARPLRSATVEINGVITTIPPALSPDEEAILNALQAPTPRH